MKLPADAIITEEKLTKYLLVQLEEDDKSLYLILSQDAFLTEATYFGNLYEIRSGLTGPNGITLGVVSIWITVHKTQCTHFVTLFPDKENA